MLDKPSEVLMLALWLCTVICGRLARIHSAFTNPCALPSPLKRTNSKRANFDFQGEFSISVVIGSNKHSIRKTFLLQALKANPAWFGSNCPYWADIECPRFSVHPKPL